MSLFGIKSNKCMLNGVQGVCKQISATAPAGADYIYSHNGADNNSRFVLTNYTKAMVGMITTNPDIDYNFSITIKRPNGFLGTPDGLFIFKDGDIEGTSNTIKVYWDNPDFDPSDDYTVLHVYIWFDGINYCGHIDGYIEAT